MQSPPTSPAPRRQGLALLLALACALLALAIVLVLVLRSSDGGEAPPPPGAAASRADPTSPAPSAAPEAADDDVEIVTYPGMEIAHGEARLDVPETLYAAANRTADVVTRIPDGETVALRATLQGWSLVAWSDAGGRVWLGWIPRDLRGAPKPGAVETTGRVEGVVRLAGVPPTMEVPPGRQDTGGCKGRAVPLEDVLVKDGMLKDVLVRIQGGPLARRAFLPPQTPVVVHQTDCMYRPPVQGAVIGQRIEITNGDPTLHNVHLYVGPGSILNQAQPKGGAPVVKALDEKGIVQLTCDMHPWMRAFVVVTANPYFAVTDEDGAFAIEGVPTGSYALEAWHPHYGVKRVKVTIGEAPATVAFEYDVSETPVGAASAPTEAY